MPSCRKPLAALAAATVAVAVAFPAAGASAATNAAPTVDPTVCQLLNLNTGTLGPTMFIGGASLATTLEHAGSTVGCQAAPAPAQPQPLPTLPG
jgi:hypothetical protein